MLPQLLSLMISVTIKWRLYIFRKCTMSSIYKDWRILNIVIGYCKDIEYCKSFIAFDSRDYFVLIKNEKRDFPHIQKSTYPEIHISWRIWIFFRKRMKIECMHWRSNIRISKYFLSLLATSWIEKSERTRKRKGKTAETRKSCLLPRILCVYGPVVIRRTVATAHSAWIRVSLGSRSRCVRVSARSSHYL